MVWSFIIGALTGISLTVLISVVACGLDDNNEKR